MKKNLAKRIIEGTLIAGALFGNSLENYAPGAIHNNYNKIDSYETCQNLKLEKTLKEESPKAFYLNPDSLNVCIKQAYGEVKKWPKEFDKRLYRLLLKQESKYNIYAKSEAGAMGISQIMPATYGTFRDSANFKKEIFNPVKNIGVSLEYLDYISNFCRKNHPGWDTLNIENKRKTILACYNAGHGRIQDANWDLESKKLKRETKNYPKIIMKDYHNPKVKVKL